MWHAVRVTAGVLVLDPSRVGRRAHAHDERSCAALLRRHRLSHAPVPPGTRCPSA